MIRVMIVEDQKLVRSLLESYIQDEDGYQLAVSIPGAAEAPILCDTEDIDLVLMDVQTEPVSYTHLERRCLHGALHRHKRPVRDQTLGH